MKSNLILVLVLLSFFTNITITAQYDVKWRDVVGCSYNSSTNSLTKNVGNSWCNAYAISANYLDSGEDGYLEYTIQDITSFQMFLGLTKYNNASCFAGIEFAMHQQRDNFIIYESYVKKFQSIGELQVGDIIRIERNGVNIYYKKIRLGTTTLLYTSTATVDPNDKLYGDFTIYYNGHSMANVKSSFGYMNISKEVEHIDYENEQCTGEIEIAVDSSVSSMSYLWSNGATTEDISGLNQGVYSLTVTDSLGGTETINVNVLYDVKWQNLVLVNYDSLSNKLTSNSGNGWIHGALSKSKLDPLEDGFAGIKIPALGSQEHQMIGLSAYNTGASYTTINYALYHNGTDIIIYESGTLKLNTVSSFGSPRVGDFYYVERVGSNIYYNRERDGVVDLLYTSVSAVNPYEELYVDCANWWNNKTIENIYASFRTPNALTYGCPIVEMELDFEDFSIGEIQISYNNEIVDLDLPTSYTIKLKEGAYSIRAIFLGNTSQENLFIDFLLDSTFEIVDYYGTVNQDGIAESFYFDELFFKETKDGVKFYDEIIEDDFDYYEDVETLSLNMQQGYLLTPNNDGENDYLKIAFPESFSPSEVSLIVKNLQDDILFSTSDYNDQWNCTDSLGNTVQIGTYIYELTIDGNQLSGKFNVEY